MARSYAELMGLEVEAERLVRCGESRAEVSRRLGVHPQTLATWALRGGWRQKDLDLERSAEASRETIMAIRHGNRQADAQKLAREQLGVFMREAVERNRPIDPAFWGFGGGGTLIAGMSAGGEHLEIGTAGC